MPDVRAMFVPSLSALAKGVDPIAWTIDVPEGFGRRMRIAERVGDLIATHVGASTSCCRADLDPLDDGDDVLEFWRDVLDDEPLGSATWADAA